MPSYEWESKYNAWTKCCSCCKTETIGTENEQESIDIFLKFYAVSEGLAKAADGLQSRCWICNNYKRRQLGITLEWLRDMLERQEGCCAICDIPISLDRGSPNPANVDHNDDTNIVRQLLCGNCNRGMGSFFHNTDFLERAISYLKFHSKEEESNG